MNVNVLKHLAIRRLGNGKKKSDKDAACWMCVGEHARRGFICSECGRHGHAESECRGVCEGCIINFIEHPPLGLVIARQ